MTEDKPGEEDNGIDVDSYQHAIDDAQRTLNQQLVAFNDISEKSWRIVRFNLLISTLFIGIFTNISKSSSFQRINIILILFGSIGFILSTIIAIIGQTGKSVSIGINTKSFKSVRENDPREIVYLYMALEEYEKAIESTHKKTMQNRKCIQISKWLTLAGATFLSIGIVLVAGV